MSVLGMAKVIGETVSDGYKVIFNPTNLLTLERSCKNHVLFEKLSAKCNMHHAKGKFSYGNTLYWNVLFWNSIK